MEIALIIVIIGALIFLSHLFAGIFSRTKIPDVLLLIIIGLCLGPFFGVVNPQHFGVVGPVFTTITLIIILFEGGLDLHFHVLRKILRRLFALAMVSFTLTMVVVGAVTYLLTNFSPIISFMLGAIVASTSPAVIVPMVRQLKMQKEARTILTLESAVSDVLSIIIALAFLEAHKLGALHFDAIAGHMISSFFFSALFGILGAFIWSIVLNKIRTIQNSIFTTPTFVFVIYGMVELLEYSGAIASLTFGVTIGNIELFKLPLLKRYIPHSPIALNETEKVFFSEIVFLLKTFFFIYIGLSIQLMNIGWLLFGMVLTLLIFVVRIPVVRLIVPKSTTMTDATMMAVLVPKGLAAAVLASLPLREGIVGGEMIQNVTYAVVLFSIILTSLLIILLERTKLGDFYRQMLSKFRIATRPDVETNNLTNDNLVMPEKIKSEDNKDE